MIKLFLHVGMGKTGTSSIQAALNNNKAILQKHNIRYLGMWFDFIDPAFEGWGNQAKFFDASEAETKAYALKAAEVFAESAAQQGITTFVLSNEGLWGRAASLKLFLDAIADQVEVSVVGYVRNPMDWLPSAYAQWGIVDKVNPGVGPGYGELARRHVKWYKDAFSWADTFGDRFVLRDYSSIENVVDDFASLIGVPETLVQERVYERRSNAELALRSLFNKRYEGSVAPGFFDKMVQKQMTDVMPLARIRQDRFDYSETPAIVQENAAIFDEIKQRFDIDLMQTPVKPLPAVPDLDVLRNEVFDSVTEIVLAMSRRVQWLEGRAAKLEAEIETLKNKV